MTTISRRLISQYLMFSLIGIVITGLGVSYASSRLSGHHQHHEHVQLLRTTAEAIAADYRQHAGKNVQHLVDRAAIVGGLRFCAVVNDGKAVCHSIHEHIGQDWKTHPLLTSGHVVERSHHADDHGPPHIEFAAPLTSGKTTHGQLVFSAHPPPSNAWIMGLLEAAPPVILLPMLVVTIGGRLIGRCISSHSTIEQKLQELAAGAPITASTLEHIDETGPVAQGWNRLVDQLQHSGTARSPVDGKTAQGNLQAFRDKQSERALQAIPEAIVITDGEGRIRMANPALAGMLNVGEETIRGGLFLELLPTGHPDAATIREKLRGDRHRPVVVELPRNTDVADGCLRIARYVLNPDDPTAAEHVWMVRDVTQQKLAERARDEFVASATHELRTPLTNIQAYAETLSLHDIDDVEQRKAFLNTINQEAGRLARFVDELLSISRMEAGAIALNKTETDVLRMLTEVSDKVRPQMDQKGIVFETTIPAKVPDLRLDKDKFTGALVNLLGNAAKYTPERGNVSLKVEVQPSALVVHVQDSGFGIAPEEISKLGSRFFRSADPRVQGETGTGLGLAFTQDVVRLHGGRLTIQSELNKGSTFTITLPVSG